MTTARLENNQLSNNSIYHFKSDLIKVDDNSFNFQLSLYDGKIIDIPIISDGYINITKLCKAGGKEYSNWYKNKNSEEIIDALERSLREKK